MNTTVEELTARRARVDAEINHARTLSARLEDLARAIERGRDVEDETRRVVAELERFGSHTVEGTHDGAAVADGRSRRAELSFLLEDTTLEAVRDAPDLRAREQRVQVLADVARGADSVLDATVRAVEQLERRAGRVVYDDAIEWVRALEAYAAGRTPWARTFDRLAKPFDPTRVADADADTDAFQSTCETLASVFDLLAVACVLARDQYTDLLVEELEAQYASGDPVTALEADPALLLPVRLETRFVEPENPTELLIRVYPDQIHVDSHEAELTEEEVTAGIEFWATLYLGWRGEELLEEGQSAVSDPDLWAFLEDVDLAAYERRIDDEVAGEDRLAARYDELKTQAWNRLLERHDERAAYIVDAVDPIEPVDPATPEEGTTSIAQTLLGRPTDEVALPSRLTFDGVDRRSETWTKRATARLLPDRWVAVLEWTVDGVPSRETVTGSVIPRGLALDPAVEPGATGEEMDWLFDFDRALEVGMALSVPLEELVGFDPATDAIDSLLVVGVKASMDATETPAAVRSVFDAHRFTDGLSLLETGTPTNLESAPDPVALEPPEPAVTSVDTDGDLLARVLALESGTGTGSETGSGSETTTHPFAHVPNGDSTRYRDAGHVNNVLWPATLGYFLRHVAVPADLAGEWDATDRDGDPSKREWKRIEELEMWLAWLDAARRYFVRYVRGGGPLPTVQVGEIPYGVLPVAPPQGRPVRPSPEDSIAQRIDQYVRGLRPLWEYALTGDELGSPAGTAATSPLDPGNELWDVLDVLERSGVAHGAQVGAQFTNRPEHIFARSAAIDVPFVDGQADAIRAEMADARAALEATLSAETNALLPDSRAASFERDANASAGAAIHAHEFVDPAFDRFVDVLRGESLTRLRTLTDLVSLTAAEDRLLVEEVLEWADVDLSVLDGEDDGDEDQAGEDGDDGLSEEERHRRRRLFERVWDEEFPPGVRHALLLSAIEKRERGGSFLPRRLLFFDPDVEDQEEAEEFLETASIPRLIAATELTREYDDAGETTSLLRSLAHYATLQEYVDGRLRLGLEVGDLPASDPDRTPGFATAYTDLFAEIPDETNGDLRVVQYAEVIRQALAGDDSADLPGKVTLPGTTVAFGESLAHLGKLDRSTLAPLTAETLDTTSHRLDAWWTSLSTARLFTYRGIGGRRPHDPRGRGEGLLVGGYGYVENLRPDAQVGERAPPAFVHTPSGDLAKTAALLRSGYDAAEGDLREALAVDLSAERVRDARWLLEGVRRGTSLGELLGSRLERRMHEVTMESLEAAAAGEEPPALMRWKHALREQFPAVKDQLTAETDATASDQEGAETARSDVLDGYDLLESESRGDFDFSSLSTTDQSGNTFQPTADEQAQFDALLAELADDLDAVSDLLLAETAHQIARGNPEKGGASLEGLERAEGVPDPGVVDLSRSETGVTHRHLLLFDPVSDGGKTPRATAEPTLESWAASLLPDHDEVECVVDWELTGLDDEHEENGAGEGGDEIESGDGSDAEDETGDETEPEAEAEAEVVLETGSETVTLADLELSNLDLLALSGDHREGRSELDARIRYYLVRNRAVPADAALELRYRETDGDGDEALALATVLEVTRSLSALLDETRAVTGEDLTHPSEPVSTGYDEDTLEELTGRDDGFSALEDIADDLESLRSLLEWKGSGDEGTGTESAGSDNEEETDGDDETSVPDLVEHAVETARDALESLPVEDLTDALEGVAADDDLTPSLFSLSPPGDPTATLLEEPGTYTVDLPLEADGETDGDEVDAAESDDTDGEPTDQPPAEPVERNPELEGEPVEEDDLPPPVSESPLDSLRRLLRGLFGGSFDLSAVFSSARARAELRTAHERLEEARSRVIAAGDSVSNLTVTTVAVALADYEESASALGDARARLADAVAAFESASDAYDESDYSHAEADAAVSIEAAEDAVTATEDAIEAADAALEGAESLPDETVDGELESAPKEDDSDPADADLTATVWGTDGGSWLERDAVADVRVTDSSLAVSVDLSAVSPGTWLVLSLWEGDRLRYRETGYVGRTDREVGDPLARLAWLAWARDRLSETDSKLSSAIDVVPWDVVESTIETVPWDDEEWVVDAEDDDGDGVPEKLTSAHRDVLEALAGIAGDAGLAAAEAATLVSTLDEVLRPWDRASLAALVSVSRASAGPEEAIYSVSSAEEAPRAVFAAPTMETVARLALPDLEDDAIVAALEAVVTLPDEEVRELHRNEQAWQPAGVDVDDPDQYVSVTQRRLAQWLYRPETSDISALGRSLERTLARLDASDTPMEREFTERFATALPDETELSHVTDVLRALLASLSDAPSQAGDTTTLEAEATAALTELEALTDVLALSEGEPEPAGAFRLAVLELVRDPLFEAGWFGIYGAVPEPAAGGTQADERALSVQVASVASKLEERLEAVDGVSVPPASAPMDERVDAAVDRLETLFGGSISVLAPFSPQNAAELEATFTDDPAGLTSDPLAVETWFQRVAQIRERVADEREASSYAAALGGESVRDFGVGQLPYTPADEWIGLDGVEPVSGTVSIVAAFGTGAGPDGDGFDPAGDAQLTGVFVDEWVEGVASETEDTALALRYDSPGSRPPQSMLVAMAPERTGWSIDALIETVEETMAYTKLRSVDADDLEALEALSEAPVAPVLPAPYYAERDRAEPTEPVMEPERAAWHSPRTRVACQLRLMRAAFASEVTRR